MVAQPQTLIPIKRAVASLSLPPGAIETFPKALGHADLSTLDAFRLARKQLRFGSACKSDLWKGTWDRIRDAFFPNVNFRRSAGELSPVEIVFKEEPFTDGDTAKVAAFIDYEGVRHDYSVNIRMDGIDTLESNPSMKLTKMIDYMTNYLMDEHFIDQSDRSELRALCEARIVYLGKLAGSVTKGFGYWVAERDIGASLAFAYTRVSSTADMCDTFDYCDDYGRIIGRILAGRPNQGEDLLAGFVESALPGYMRNAREMYYDSYLAKLNLHSTFIERMRSEHSELYKLFDPSSALDPSVIFSEEESRQLALLWKDFTGIDGRAINDLNCLEVFLGVAPVYQKYRGHVTALYLSAQRYALGFGDCAGRFSGLVNDPIYRLQIPDPDLSPLFRKYEHDPLFTGGKPLLPKDCCDEFGCPV